MLKQYRQEIIVIFLYCCCTQFTSSVDVVRIFDLQHGTGPSLTLEIKGCKNLPPEWNDKASSINLYGRCVQLYQNEGCTGRMITVSPENRLWLNNLKKFGFNDQLSSIGKCAPKVPKLKSGRYAIRNPWDGINKNGVLTVLRLNGGRTTVIKQENWRKDLSQKWDIEKQEDSVSTFHLTSRIYQNNPITYENNEVEHVNWNIEGLPNQLFMLRKQGTNNCLALADNLETTIVDCRNEDKAQQWTFIKIFGASDYD